jgi:hypothetical protein
MQVEMQRLSGVELPLPAARARPVGSGVGICAAQYKLCLPPALVSNPA